MSDYELRRRLRRAALDPDDPLAAAAAARAAGRVIPPPEALYGPPPPRLWLLRDHGAGEQPPEEIWAPTLEEAQRIAEDVAREWYSDTRNYRTEWVRVSLVTLPEDCEACNGSGWLTYDYEHDEGVECDECMDPEVVLEWKVEIDPIEPLCLRGESHEWGEETVTSSDVGCGVKLTSQCDRCELLRIVNTHDYDRADGEQGLGSLTYDERGGLGGVYDEDDEGWYD